MCALYLFKMHRNVSISLNIFPVGVDFASSDVTPVTVKEFL